MGIRIVISDMGGPIKILLIKKWTLSLTQPQKLAKEARIAQDYIKTSIFPHPINVGLNTLSLPRLEVCSVDNLIWGPTSVNNELRW